MDVSKEKPFTTPVTIDYDIELANKYIEFAEEKDYAYGLMQCAKSMVLRETDLLSNEERVETDYYKLFLKSINRHYGIQVTLAYNNSFSGLISLLRSEEKNDFSERDIFIFEILKDHISYRLHRELNEKIQYKSLINFRNKNINYNIYEEKYYLTKRELDVFKLLSEGYSNNEIGKILFVSQHTIKKHNLNIYKKLGLNNRLQLFRLLESDQNSY